MNNLFTGNNYVQTPFVGVIIGDYDFGFYKEVNNVKKYPNYIQSLEVQKINGQVNKYTLVLNYMISQFDDPNFFEKVFSSVSQTRAITFYYGDLAVQNYVYKNESALITSIKKNIDLDGSRITYTIGAVSQCALASSGSYTFKQYNNKKPSVRIREILDNPIYGLKDLFPGMRNKTLVDNNNLIPGDDLPQTIYAKENISILDYLSYLVSLMTPDVYKTEISTPSFYILTYNDDTSGIFGGAYFKISLVDTKKEHPEAFDVSIGYPGNNYVFGMSIDNDEGYSMYYDYQSSLNKEQYVKRINEKGEYEYVYAPVLSSGNSLHQTTSAERNWWSKVTQYPIKAQIKIKGLLRPTVLMSYLNVNIYFHGERYIDSGLFIITKQVDRIDSSGYTTTLDMVRVASNS